MNTVTMESAPRVGVTGERLRRIAEALAVDTAAMAETFATSRAACITAMLAALGVHAAQIDRDAAAEFLSALALRIKHGEASARLDAARLDRATRALFEAEIGRGAG